MDPLAALGLACNVVQFVQFASDLFRNTIKIYRSAAGCTDDVVTLEALYQELCVFSDDLTSSYNNSIRYVHGLGAKSNNNVTSFRTLTTLCRSDCEKLLGLVSKLKAQDHSRRSWKSFRAALAMVWEKDDIKDLEDRLKRTQTTMTLHICTISSHAQALRAEKLEKLHAESQRLQFNQSAKLDQIGDELSHLRQFVEQVRLQNSKQSPSVDEIEAIEQKISRLSISQEAIATEQAVLKSLSFKERKARHESIPVAYEKTFGWVYESEKDAPPLVTSIREWMKGGDGVFWVSGKPGSGKSTFMKFIVQDCRTRRLLEEWSGTKQIAVGSHYFWSAGTAMQKSEQGLLRSLLYDIFRQCSDLMTEVCGDRHPEPGEENEDGLLPWTISDLRATLRKVVAREITSVRFCFFVDGLDEYDGDQDELCRILGDLAQSPNIKVCVSSRTLNVFEQAFGEEPRSKLYIQNLTRNDILEYVRFRLYSHPRWKFLSAKASQGDWLVEEIERRASGVFLWVFLVTRVLRESLTNRDGFSDLCQRLKSIPVELEMFFQQILDSVKPFYHEKMSTSLQMTIAAEEPLHAMAYHFHDMDYEDQNYVFELPVQPYGKEEEEELREQTKWRLNSRSHGLLELNPSTDTVTFLHRTVRDFLINPKWSEFLKSKAPKGFELSRCLLKVYTAMIKRSSFEHAVVRRDFAAFKDCYLKSLTTNALTYARKLQESKTHRKGCFELLEEIDRVLQQKFSEGQASFMPERHPPEAFFRELLICGQHTDFLAWKLPRHPDYFCRFGAELIPNILAVKDVKEDWRSRGVQMLRLVLETQKLDMNEAQYHMDVRRIRTPWTIFIGHLTSWSRGMANTVEERFWSLLESNVFSLMLRQGADPNATIWNDETKGRPAFAAYLNLAFEMRPDAVRRGLYLQVLEEFFRAGANLNPSETEFATRSIQQKLGNSISIIPTVTAFFGRLTVHDVTKLQDCDWMLLAKVVDMLLSSEERLGAWWAPTLNDELLDKFPEEICQGLRARFSVRKRGPQAELLRDNVKFPKVSSNSS